MSEDRLRPYQREACTAVWSGWRTTPRQLLVLPTGAGKTYTAGALVWRRRQVGRTLWLAHRKELLGQAKESLENLGLTVEVEQADERASHLPTASDVVVASVPTLHEGRLATWPAHSFATIIADEAHHAVAKTWMAVLDHFPTDHMGRRTRVLGLTATPDRTDGIALGAAYDDAAFTYQLRDAVRDGWLVKPTPETVYCEDLDLSQIKVIAGDLSASELDAHVADRSVLHQIASPIAHQGKSELACRIAERQVVIYMPGVASAEGLEEILAGYEWVGADQVACVTGKTTKEKRKEVLDAFARNELRFLVNVMVLTEGWDAPGASVIVVGRPTKSRSLLSQMMGRGTRTLKETNIDQYPTAEERKAAIAASRKPDCMVVDFTGRTEIRTASPADVLAGTDLPDETWQIVKDLQEAEPQRDLEDVLAEAEQLALETEAGREVEKRRARVQAVVQYTTCPIDLVDFNEAHIEMVEDARKAARAARRRECKRCGGSGKRADGAACGICKGKGRVKGTPYRNGEVVGPSDKQAAFLERHGIRLPESAHIRQASAAIDLVITRGLCSIKQARVLRRAGLRTNLTKPEASAALDALSSAGWQRTPEIVARWGA